MKKFLPSFLVLTALLATDVAVAATDTLMSAPAAGTGTLSATTNVPGWGKLKRKKRRQAAYQRLRKRRH